MAGLDIDSIYLTIFAPKNIHNLGFFIFKRGLKHNKTNF